MNIWKGFNHFEDDKFGDLERNGYFFMPGELHQGDS